MRKRKRGREIKELNGALKSFSAGCGCGRFLDAIFRSRGGIMESVSQKRRNLSGRLRLFRPRPAYKLFIELSEGEKPNERT
jgi:hypothetical protein